MGDINITATSPEAVGPLKITVVGDGTVGKTSLIFSYIYNSFPGEYELRKFTGDNITKNIKVDGLDFTLQLWDTLGQEDYDRLRPLSYPNTDCFILCFAINKRSSFDNIECQWIRELRHHCPQTPIVLVGTKSDVLEESDPKDCVSEAEGKKMKSKIKANAFVHCSAKTGDGLEEVFTESVRAILKQKTNRQPRFCKFL